jgi:hypothetical protein
MYLNLIELVQKKSESAKRIRLTLENKSLIEFGVSLYVLLSRLNLLFSWISGCIVWYFKEETAGFTSSESNFAYAFLYFNFLNFIF